MNTLARLLLAASLTTGLLRADDIVLVDGNTIDGVSIQSETITEIKYRKSGGRGGVQSVPSSDVRTVTYSSTNADYREGLKLLLAGDTLEGAGLLAGAASDTGNRLENHHRATGLVTAADALIGYGDMESALGLYNELLHDYKDTRHQPRALLGRARADLALGNHDAAIGGFQQLKDNATSLGYGQQWEMEATFFELFARQVKGGGDIGAIRDGYADLKAKAESAGFAAIATKCGLQLGRLNLAAKDYNRALPAFNDIIAERLDTDRAVAAGAYLGRGSCLFALADKTRSSGNAEGAKDDFKAALLDFLRVHTHYADVQEVQAEAIYWANQCFENIGGSENDYHAAVLKARLKGKYPRSPWAARVD